MWVDVIECVCVGVCHQIWIERIIPGCGYTVKIFLSTERCTSVLQCKSLLVFIHCWLSISVRLSIQLAFIVIAYSSSFHPHLARCGKRIMKEQCDRTHKLCAAFIQVASSLSFIQQSANMQTNMSVWSHAHSVIVEHYMRLALLRLSIKSLGQSIWEFELFLRKFSHRLR